MKTIKVSDELHTFLTNQAVRKGETYDEIIKRLVKKNWGMDIKKEDNKGETG